MTAAMTYLSQYDSIMAVAPAEDAIYLEDAACLTAHPYDAGRVQEQIDTQYCAPTNSMLHFYESWSNWRRSDYPLLAPENYPINATGGQFLRCFPYPTSEITSHPYNNKAASSAVLGGGNVIGRVYWDK